MNSSPADLVTAEQLQEYAASGSLPETSVLAVLACMRSDDEEVRACAADALECVEAISKTLTQQIVKLVTDENEVIANWSCKLLGKSECVAEAQAALTDALEKHSSVGVKQQAALSLGCFPELSVASRAALQVAASEQDPRLKRLATQALTR